MPRGGGGGRSCGGGGGGRIHGGGLAGGRLGRSSDGSWSGTPPPLVTIIPPRNGSGPCTYKSNTEYWGEPWYNTDKPENRWERALSLAKLACPGAPDTDLCQSYIELLVDLPPEEATLEEHGLPPQLYPDISINDPPLKLPDPPKHPSPIPYPPDQCKIIRQWLQSCHRTHFYRHWKCDPFETLVEDHCSRKVRQIRGEWFKETPK